MSFTLCRVWPECRVSLSQVKPPWWDPHYVCVSTWGTMYTKATMQMADRKCRTKAGGFHVAILMAAHYSRNRWGIPLLGWDAHLVWMRVKRTAINMARWTVCVCVKIKFQCHSCVCFHLWMGCFYNIHKPERDSHGPWTQFSTRFRLLVQNQWHVVFSGLMSLLARKSRLKIFSLLLMVYSCCAGKNMPSILKKHNTNRTKRRKRNKHMKIIITLFIFKLQEE